ncbi:hypothetical protein SNE40_022703 [Patella caerulea]|uniref:Low-density lipoprotein receptor-related protein 2 n=1 Tax=Patella caerulea TaxID=87958 RepID=A0AAN8GB95_PATCE
MWLGLCRYLLLLVVFGSKVTVTVSSQKDTTCPSDTFHCKDEVSPGSHCIPKNWVCDSDEDCPGGEDETADCSIPTCPSNQFQCSRGSARCVPNGWVCDGENDCDDGSDENATTCKTHKRKESHLGRGAFVDTFKCVPNKYQCPGTHTCIHMEQVCDGTIDCVEDRADEGGHCLNTGCKTLTSCKAKCRETLQGPQCYCTEGLSLNNSVCIDLDECKYDGYCDQQCENKFPGYICSCSEGYHKPVYTKDNDKEGSCEVDGSPRLIFANTKNLQQIDINGEELTPAYIIEGDQIETLDYDLKNNTVCWIGSVLNSTESGMYCSKLDKPNESWRIASHHKLTSVEQLARDWVGDNFYFADDVKETIFLCRGDGMHCVNIITIGIKRPKSLALDSTRGYIFFADWSMNAKIERANMDGSNKMALVVKKIVHPNGLALDLANKHVYWGDSFLDYIERVDYNGGNRRLIAQGVNVDHVHGLTVLGNYLYVTNHHNNSIVRVHRYIENDIQVINRSPLSKPGDIHVIHPVKQPAVSENICGNKKCDHICVPVPHGSTQTAVAARCLCRAGYALVNGTACQKTKADRFLLYANAQQGSIQGISLGVSESQQVIEPIVNLNRPIAIAFDAKNEDIYYSDVSLLRIGRRKVYTDDEPEVFLDAGVTSSEGLAIDWIGRNLYLTDDGHQTINVVRLDNRTIHYTVVTNVSHPKAIVVDPNTGYMYWTDWVLKPSEISSKIEKACMDGSNRMTLVSDEIQWPNSLTLDFHTQTIYWTDAYYDRIESISVTGTERKVIVKFENLNHPYGIAVFRNFIYWAESLSGQIFCYDSMKDIRTIIRNDSNPLFDLKLYDPSIQQIGLTTLPCAKNNGGCEEICLSVPNGQVCQCGKGRKLKADKIHCEDNPDYKAPEACNSQRQFSCKDGSCINNQWTCDGDRDCLDGSDEDYSDTGYCKNKACDEPSMHRCLNSSCIHQHLVCDGHLDCPHGDDESKCTSKDGPCAKNHTKCGGASGRCIPDSWICDNEIDCADGSDEKEHCDTAKCVEDQFQCAFGHCIPYSYRCDNEYDCPDNSDEMDCKSWCHPQQEFSCKDSSICVLKKYICDGEANCPDASDEENCNITRSHCNEHEFLCDGGICIPSIWKCDGDKDCTDGTDESSCSPDATKTCHPMEFQCTDKSRCVPKSWKCDGEADCADKSDEQHCSKDCQYPNFRCNAQGNVCLPPHKVCDDVADCVDNTDEGRGCHTMINPCLPGNNDCSHTCHRTPTGYVCSCPEKKKISNDNVTCEDIDVCSTWGICSQKCESTPVGHRCFCNEGYILQNDGYSCKADDDVAVYIIYSNRHEMRRVDLEKMTFVSLVAGLRNTIAIDYHYEKQLIFWTDVIDDKIYRGKMILNTLTNIVPIINVGLATTEGLAVDWIGDKLYWVESNLDQIEVADLDGKSRRTLVAGAMTSPRAIVVDPRYGALFWTDWDGANPRIESCSMSGTNRTILFGIRPNYAQGGWPNGLTLDYDAERLYWIDARSDSIHSITYKGEDHHLILQSHESLAQPFAITLFEHYVYWTDWKTNSLSKANKYNGSGIHQVQKTFTQPFDLHVYHPKRQPKAFNPCAINNGGCSHLCLIGFPSIDGGNTTANCRCPHRMKIHEDGKTCGDDNTFLIFVKKNEIRGVDLDNANFNVIPSITVRLVDNNTSTTAIDYDIQEERLYWTDLKRNVINSAYLNGSGVETIIDSGISHPEGFAIDYLSRNMYFSSYNKKQDFSTISVSKLNGAYRTEIISRVGKMKQVNSLAINPKIGVMFWSDIGGSKHTIIKANMDGSDPTVLVSDASKPASLTVDTFSNSLYYISRGHQTINRCFFNGTCSQVEVTLNDMSLVSMTIFKENIYVSNTNHIIRINPSRDNEKVIMRDNTPYISAMQVYNKERGKGGANVCSVNNAGCSQLCLPTPSHRICKCTAGFQIAPDGTSCNGITSFMLFATDSQIQGFSVNNSGQVALPPVSKISLASAIDFHAADHFIYWIDSNARTISRIKRDLTNREEIISDGLNGVEGIAVDWIANNIYWTDRSHNTVEVAKTDGSTRYVILHKGLDNPTTIVVHPKMGYLYFVDDGVSPRIMQARLDGSELKPIINTDITKPTGLTIDYEKNNLYWCDQKRNELNQLNLKTNARRLITKNMTDCVSVTVFGDYIYWADTTDNQGSIKKARKSDGTGMEYVKKNLLNKLKDIVVFDEARQTGTNICEDNKYGCAELCLYNGTETPTCVCSYGKLTEDGKHCEEFTDFLMFSEVTAIGSAHMSNDTDPNPPYKLLTNGTNMKNVIGLAYDYSSQRIYYSDIQRGDIQTIFFNGTGHKVVMSGIGSAEGLVFDSINKDLYLTSYTNSSINRIHLGGSDEPKIETLIQLSDKDHPRAIVLHVCRSRIFWTNWNDEKPRIQRSYLNGFQPESIITEQIQTPNGLAIDHKAEKLYWSDARLDKIERCDLDGSNRVIIVTSIPQHSFGLTVYADYIYWTDWMLRAVLRANKYDGSQITWLKKNIKRQPMAIVAIAEDADNCKLNQCYQNMFGCEGTCTTNEKGQPRCECPKGQFLLPDGRRCASDKNLKCNMTDFICDDGKMCISIERTCNGISDCIDASDESKEFCETRRCPVDYFMCTNRRCIYLDKVCNSVNECGDNSDERDCSCNQDEFKCDNGMCILNKYRCDRDSDCLDHSDEKNCNLNCTDVEMDGERVQGLISCNETSACIFPMWLCDGTNDCWDNSDEKDCNPEVGTACPADSFTCGSGSCIPPQWRCDKDFDCADVSDEANCTYSCNDDQFACNDSTCLPKTWECDKHPDCPDQSDEHENCDIKTCNDDEFRCGSGKCIPKAWKCDGDSDCEEDDDESISNGCPPVLCQENEFQCLNRKCITSTFFCDRDDDCGDNSDELSCFYPTCGSDEFKCVNRGMCVNITKRCDGLFDCPDHTDEANCTVVQCGGDDTKFMCSNGLCIPEELVCNDQDDCGDKSDEPVNCGLNECDSNTECHHLCIEKKIGYACACHPGYKLRPDNRSCEDVNECDTTYPCSQLCTNTMGSFHCNCTEGYMMAPDRTNCKSETKPVLIVTNRYYIRNVSVPVGNSSRLSDDQNNAVAIDVDWQDQYIYWSDITSRNSSINRMKYNISSNAKREVQVLHSSTVRNPDGLAVDWVGRNLYWCDKTTDTIEVSKLDGKYRRVLLREGLQEPRGLEVFPQKGVLFYTDWGDNHHIGRMWMDGSKRQTIIKDNLRWPNALTIDYITEKIIWADGSLDYIAMANLDGSGRRIIIGDSVKVPHVFALATFENYIYWTDWEHMGIFYAHKSNGENITLLTNMVHKPMGLQIFHPLKQIQPDVNPCAENNGNCSHLCLLRPHEGNLDYLEHICSCPENFHLSKDNKNCISNCTSAQFLCEESSKCIPFWWKCDGHPDCGDRSDEPHDCKKYLCVMAGLFQCDNATDSQQCFPPSMICDGKTQCDDGSDEKNCESYPCLEHHMKCHADNKCIPDHFKCDHNKTCSDGEDELDCPATTCSANQFGCANGRCVPYVWKCDNDDDCGDWSDEPQNCTTISCKADHIKCKSSGRCIPEAWTCDGDRDCGEDDDTDEHYGKCQDRTCDPTYFHCQNGHCIPGRWKCDDYDDCRDNSDEMNCAPRNCSESEFRCTEIGKCIPSKLRCNKEINCEDGSDEVNCDDITCSDDEFMCSTIKHCIPKSWRCDSDTDCADGTDEWNCTRNCSEHEFKCDNSLCQSALWRCDGDNDCGDGSDEHNCTDYVCTPGRFRCNSTSICIWYNMVCDGKRDCEDGEDEGDFCEEPKTCESTEFKCNSTKIHRCIGMEKLCDNVVDCKEDGSDENEKFCESKSWQRNCSVNNGGCQYHCTQDAYSVKCSCKAGYKLDTDGLNCIHHNPCSEFGVCSQMCNFTSLALKPNCFCENGFTKYEKSCFAQGDPPTMLVAEEGRLIRTALTNLTNQKESHLTLSPNDIDNHIVAMDVDVSGTDWRAFTVLLSKNHTWIVVSTKINKKAVNKRQKRDNSDAKQNLYWSHADIRGLTVDWVSKRLYWTESATQTIKAANYQGERIIEIISSDLEDPQDIVIHPKNKQLFWTDQGMHAKIERSNLDGTNRTVLVDDNIIWPNGLAIDYFNDRIYWADTKKYTIESVDVNGNDRRRIQTFNASDPPYKLELFEDFIYVLTYKTFSVIRIHKFVHSNVFKKMYVGINRVRDLTIIQEHKQQQSISNKCEDGAKIGEMCAATQSCFNDWSEQGFSCLCPNLSVYNDTDKKCNFLPNHETCPDGFCKHNGNCSFNVHSKPKCRCTAQYTGDHCEIDKCSNYCIIGDCIVSPKHEGQVECRCHEGYRGERCDQYICTGHCKNDGKCHVKDDKAYCFCSSVHTGELCENDTTDSCHQCKNGATCETETSGYVRCNCPDKFKGKYCDECTDLYCYNNGVCQRYENGTAHCACPDGFSSATNCERNDCEVICKSNGKDRSKCNCPCQPGFSGPDCKRKLPTCNNVNCYHGNCTIVNDKAKCKCNEMYEGSRCDKCKCEPEGECIQQINGKIVCSCNAGFTGQFCESKESMTTSSSPLVANPLTIVIPIIVVFILIILIITAVICKRRRSWQQYRHKRMQEPRNLDVNNPIYLQNDEDVEDLEPVETSPIYTGNKRINFLRRFKKNTNFANPMYDVYNGESMTMLLQSRENEENQLLEDGLTVRYFGTGEVTNNNTTSKA